MKYVKTYEGFIGNILFKIISSKYLKRIVSNLNKLLYENENKKFRWLLMNKNLIKLYGKVEKFEKLLIEIKAEHQWLEIEIIHKNIEQIEYLESLLIKYGDLFNKSYQTSTNIYYLILPNVEKVINELNEENFMNWKDIKKYNL